MISVLIPSRGRPERLARSLKSLRENAEGHEVRFIVRLDEDDAHLYSDVSADVIVGPANGYGRLNECYNEMAAAAPGGWLWLWNDDCVVKTRGWDRIIEEQERRVVTVLNPGATTLVGIFSAYFPVIPKRWVDLVGHWSLHTCNDSWVESIGRRLRRMVDLPQIVVEHDPPDYTAKGYGPSLHWPEVQIAIARDLVILSKHMDERW